MTPELVIFDCDGVLVDTEPTTDRVISDNLARFGLNIAPQEIHRMFAGGTIAGVGQEATRLGATLPATWEADLYEEVFAALRKGVPVIAGVIDLIHALDRKGIKRAIASNGPVAKMQISLTPSGLFDLFAGRIYSGHDHGPKPKPDMLQKILADHGVTPEEAVMIDDMPAGFLAAKAAGMRCFGYVADGDPARIGDTGAMPVTTMGQIADALGLS
ncbi:haloacid dehalogenase superfamily, subfamily IA, variant 3 with third motif having DD or ED [Yoonia tamlensis]|uniref:phosphoglycolate phosphatase n=1 Tax=Yoonia tamlensis TaxID=390270 RepID=A0A1I6HZM1_9RHOB|nr:HAD family phosphatase [Yoonia tamlensis]SFR59844.1 haloacid dehalogenase superfamily, subfamily IA, variant 3 with third motif having DD or ED [Yoonia tamlensis]